MKARPQLLPAYFAVITANLLPVYGAYLGKLVFFQILYLYWFECVLLIFFDALRIALARGTVLEPRLLTFSATSGAGAARCPGWASRTWMILKMSIGRMALLLFYLIFIVLFIMLQVTDKVHMRLVLETVIFRNVFFNTSLALFAISMLVQLLTGFLLNGKYKVASPLNYYSLFDFRTLLLHVMIISVVFIHKFLFEQHSYAAKGEIVYISLFMLIKALHEMSLLSKAHGEDPQGMPMI